MGYTAPDSASDLDRTRIVVPRIGARQNRQRRRSALEDDFLELCCAHGLPRPRGNVRAALGRP